MDSAGPLGKCEYNLLNFIQKRADRLCVNGVVGRLSENFVQRWVFENSQTRALSLRS